MTLILKKLCEFILQKEILHLFSKIVKINTKKQFSLLK